MKPIFVTLVVIAALSVEAANHHKKHKETNVEIEEEPGDGDEDGDFEWPKPERIHNYDVPEAFNVEGSNSPNSEPVTPKHHGRSRHQSHAH